MKNTITMLLAICSFALAVAQTGSINPKIIVIPYTKSGEDLVNVIENDINKRIVLAKIREAFDKRGYSTIDFMALARTVETSADFAHSTSELLKKSGADIYVEAEIDVVFSSSGNSVNTILTAFDAVTGESLSNKVGNSGKFYTDDIGRLGSKAVEKVVDEFVDTMQSRFSVASTKVSTKRLNHYKDEIDSDIPEATIANDATFVFSIGNENYMHADPVPFAINDADIFAEYCKKTLGVSKHNISIYKDATYGTMLQMENRIKEIAEAFADEIGNITFIFYYSGHGFPEEGTQNAFLLPIDGNPKQPEICYSLQRFYSHIGNLGAKLSIVFIDACFSGSKRGNGMISQARGTAIKPRDCEPSGNTLVFSAATGMQTAYPYEEKGHGMFTYFLLDKLRQSKGNVSLGELCKYVSAKVNQYSVLINQKKQSPDVVASPDINDWKSITLQ